MGELKDCAEPIISESLYKSCLFFLLSQEYIREGGYGWRKLDMSGDRWKDPEDLYFISTSVFTI